MSDLMAKKQLCQIKGNLSIEHRASKYFALLHTLDPGARPKFQMLFSQSGYVSYHMKGMESGTF